MINTLDLKLFHKDKLVELQYKYYQVSYANYLMLPNFLLSQFDYFSTPTYLNLAQQIQEILIKVPFSAEAINTAYLKIGAGDKILLLHGFDSSLLEFTHLIPYLTERYTVYAVDLWGFGFTERKLGRYYTPETLKTHLYHFCQTAIAEPIVVVGASMGGGAAIDLAWSYPELVKKLILIDSVGFSGTFPLGKFLLPPFDGIAVEFWRQRKQSAWKLSQALNINKQSTDALLMSLLPSYMPLWKETMQLFTRSGGYLNLASKISQIKQPTLIIWGENDQELGSKDAEKFNQAISNSQLVWIKGANHAPQWEKPEMVSQAVINWLK